GASWRHISWQARHSHEVPSPKTFGVPRKECVGGKAENVTSALTATGLDRWFPPPPVFMPSAEIDTSSGRNWRAVREVPFSAASAVIPTGSSASGFPRPSILLTSQALSV